MDKNNLRKFRAGATQSEIAKAAGISKQHLSRIENGEQQGSLKVWKRLAAYFDTTIDELTKRSDNNNAQRNTLSNKH